MTVDVVPRTRRRATKSTAAATAAAAAEPAPTAVPEAIPVAPPSLAPYIHRTTYAPRAEPMISSSPAYAIGEIAQTVFDCPVCSRPLALGVRRCPGCRTRLVNGVTLGKASTFTAAGLVIGLVFGGGGVLFGLANAAAPAAAIVAAPSGAPAGGPVGGGASAAIPSAPAATPSSTAIPTATPQSAIPAAARAALVQLSATNQRLAGAGAGLRTALADTAFDASAVAQILRSVSADTVYAEQLAAGITWPKAASLGASLASAYSQIHGAAADGLLASVRNTAAYRAAATRIVALVEELTVLDAAIRSTASAAGLDLPAAPAAVAP
jgi:hypothetical protein